MLTHYANKKTDGIRQPDENYAREILQLFSIGLWELNIDGSYKMDIEGNRISTYNNDDIYQMARVFTGLTRPDKKEHEYYSDWDPVNMSANYNSFNDLNSNTDEFPRGVPSRLKHHCPWVEPGTKKVLQKEDGSYHIDIPAYTGDIDFNQSGRGDNELKKGREFTKYAQNMITTVCEALVNHPNTAPFVCKNLIIQTTTANPSPEYVARVAMVFRMMV